MINNIKNDLNKLKNPQKAKILSGFFKTGKGQYGEGDIFLGIQVPLQRQVAKKYIDTSLSDIKKLLYSKIHEYRFTALILLVSKYKIANEKNKEKIFKFYLANAKQINNWDLVDTSTPQIVGDYLLNRDKKILYKLMKSNNLWERRISILTTFTFIRNNMFSDTIKISEALLSDEHDLIHKAVGWMLREIGKKDEKELINFLDKNSKKMPRTMLRYAIEKLSPKKRKYYLSR